MNIKDFNQQNLGNNKKENNNEGIKIDEEKFEQVKDDYTDLVTEFLSRYGNMSEEQLISEMMRLVAEKKAQGNFDPQKIRQIAEQVAPMLNDEQRAKMYNLLNYLD